MTLAMLWVLLAATLLMAAGGAWARARQRSIGEYRTHRDRYFAMAKSLIKDDALPLALALVLRQVGASLNDPAVLRGIVKAAATDGHMGARAKGKRPSDRLWDLLQKSPADIRKRFIAAGHEACLAVSYRTVLFGGLIRRAIRRRNHKHDRADQAAIAQLVRAGQRHPPPEYADRLTERACAV